MARPIQTYTVKNEEDRKALEAEESTLLPNLKWPELSESPASKCYHRALRIRIARDFSSRNIVIENLMDENWKEGAETPVLDAYGEEFKYQWQALLVLFGTPSQYPFLSRKANVAAGKRNAPEYLGQSNAGEKAISQALVQLCEEFGFTAIFKIYEKDQQRLANLVRATCNFERCNRTTVSNVFESMLSDKKSTLPKPEEDGKCPNCCPHP
jgi:hypothetical protein